MSDVTIDDYVEEILGCRDTELLLTESQLLTIQGQFHSLREQVEELKARRTEKELGNE